MVQPGSKAGGTRGAGGADFLSEGSGSGNLPACYR